MTPYEKLPQRVPQPVPAPGQPGAQAMVCAPVTGELLARVHAALTRDRAEPPAPPVAARAGAPA